MHCSQMCDRCKPAEMKAFVCESCGKVNFLSRKDCLYALGYWRMPGKEGDVGTSHSGSCRQCGAGLAAVVSKDIIPLECEYSEIVCGYPCRRRDRARNAADAPCRKQVFVSTYKREEER